MPILLAPTDTDLMILHVHGTDKTIQHLRELGIVPAMHCRVLSSEPSGVILRVGDSRLALDINLAKAISVVVA
jgi:Fe2+ transport system protein FeoA